MKRVILCLIFVLLVGFVNAADGIEFFASADNVEITAQIKDGEVSFDFLYGDDSQFTNFGRNDYNQLRSSYSETIVYDRDTDDYFIVSSSEYKETYLMRATNFVLDGITNKSDIQYLKDGVWTNKKSGAKSGDIFSIGNAELGIQKVDRFGKFVELKSNNDDTVFNVIYATNGDYIYIPTSSLPASQIEMVVRNLDFPYVKYFFSVQYGYVEVERMEHQECVDSDGGKDYSIRGLASGQIPGNDNVAEDEDFCVIELGKPMLYEYYCEDNVLRRESIECSECDDGVCIFVNMICADSDGGKNYYVKGITYGPYVNNTDSCSSDGIYVYEEYCNDLGTQLGEYYKCPSGCFDGVCVSCLENWSCASWSTCTDGLQTRVCNDLNSCGTIDNRPSFNQNCVAGECSEDWTCTSWGSCVNDKKVRVCTDSSGCGTVENKPSLSQSCVSLLDELDMNDVDEYIDEYKIEFEGKEFAIRKTENGELFLKVDNEEIPMDSIMDIVKEFSEYSSLKEEVNVLSEEDIEDMVGDVDNVDKIELREEGEKSVYVLTGTKKARLFFIIPMSASIEKIVDASTGKVILIKRPWWHFLAFGV